MIGQKVRINKKDKFVGDVFIIDKMITNMAHYTKSAIMNNASFEVYVGKYCDLDGIESECPIILFEPTDITYIY